MYLCVWLSRFVASLRARLKQLHPSANCSLREDHMVHVHFKEEIGMAELIPLVTTYIILFAYIYFSTRKQHLHFPSLESYIEPKKNMLLFIALSVYSFPGLDCIVLLLMFGDIMTRCVHWSSCQVPCEHSVGSRKLLD